MRIYGMPKTMGVLGILFFIIFHSGCALDRQGLRPSTVCHVAQDDLKAQMTPWRHAYRFKGGCTIGEESGTFDISAVWRKKGDGSAQGKAIVRANYQGQNLEAYVSANCPDGDPLLYKVNCTQRMVHGSLCATRLWAYYDLVFKQHMLPDVLSEAQKAVLRAKDRWIKGPCKVIVPSQGLPPNLRYQNPANVPIVIQLPFTAGRPEHWKVKFALRRWNSGTKSWSSLIYYISNKVYLSAAKTHVASKMLSLARGKYKFYGSNALYFDADKNKWESGWFETPVVFWVGKLIFKPLRRRRRVPAS